MAYRDDDDELRVRVDLLNEEVTTLRRENQGLNSLVEAQRGELASVTRDPTKLAPTPPLSRAVRATLLVLAVVFVFEILGLIHIMVRTP